MNRDAVRQVLTEVFGERERQSRKWGEQNHADAFWLGILMEEVGEVAKAVIEADGGQQGERGGITEAQEALANELVQVAAVAVAWVEAIRRGKQPTGRASNGFVEPVRAAVGRELPSLLECSEERRAAHHFALWDGSGWCGCCGGLDVARMYVSMSSRLLPCPVLKGERCPACGDIVGREGSRRDG